MSHPSNHYFLFATDHQIYGPADVPTLQQWAREGLITPTTWIYHQSGDLWLRAEKITDLVGYLAPTAAPLSAASGISGLRPGQVRRIRLLSDMTDKEAETFIGLIEKVKVRSFSSIIKQGDAGDAMFLILEGEAHVIVRAEEREDTIATLSVGDFFGEMSLLDSSPRSATVTATKDCTLLQLSKQNLEKIVADHPELAARFLMAMTQFLGGRIRATNERFTQAKNFAQGAAGQSSSPRGMSIRR